MPIRSRAQLKAIFAALAAAGGKVGKGAKSAARNPNVRASALGVGLLGATGGVSAGIKLRQRKKRKGFDISIAEHYAANPDDFHDGEFEYSKHGRALAKEASKVSPERLKQVRAQINEARERAIARSNKRSMKMRKKRRG